MFSTTDCENIVLAMIRQAQSEVGQMVNTKTIGICFNLFELLNYLGGNKLKPLFLCQ